MHSVEVTRLAETGLAGIDVAVKGKFAALSPGIQTCDC
jgi:hypothetical protein